MDSTNKLQIENRSLENEIKKLNEKIAYLEAENVTALAIGDAVLDGISEVRRDGIVISVNESYCNITGISRDEILGQNVIKMHQEGFFSKIVSTEVVATGKKISSMSTIRRNGKIVLITGTPIFDNEKNIEKVIVIMRDVTKINNLKEKLESAESKERDMKNQIEILEKNNQFTGLLGKSKEMMKIKDLIKCVAATDATVLITGDTGSGKEVVAREIFELSMRNNEAYIKVNCAAIPENLLESELFGYVKGAFTGADKSDKKGLFLAANKGTILLDEISEMPIKLQPKLLRVLQDREITPVGGTNSIKIDVRVIASCNKNLKELVKAGQFRADLYYRLNVVPIKIPDLKSRKDDIVEITKSFLDRFNERHNKKKQISSTAIFALMKYNWPGNVRELENMIERMVIISENIILTNEDVYTFIQLTQGEKVEVESFLEAQVSLKKSVEILERKLITQALEEGGSTYAAAKILKTTQPTIVRKSQKLGIETRKSYSQEKDI